MIEGINGENRDEIIGQSSLAIFSYPMIRASRQTKFPTATRKAMNNSEEIKFPIFYEAYTPLSFHSKCRIH